MINEVIVENVEIVVDKLNNYVENLHLPSFE